MHATAGCQECSYLAPGCKTCETVPWNTGIPLLQGGYLTCTSCQNNEMFVDINPRNPAKPVKCTYCQAKFDGCSKCGTYGDTCTGCYPTHVDALAGWNQNFSYQGPRCVRCDKYMYDCLTCFDKERCKTKKPRRLLN